MKHHEFLFSLIQIPNVTCCHPCSLSPSNCTPFLGRLAANTVTEKLIIIKILVLFSIICPYSASPPSHRERCCWSTSCRRACLPCTSSQHDSYGGKYQTEKYRKQFPIISPTLSTFSESLCTLDTLRLNLSLVDAFSSEICSCRVKKKLFIYNIISTFSVANLLAQTRLNSPRWAFCSKCPPFW